MPVLSFGIESAAGISKPVVELYVMIGSSVAKMRKDMSLPIPGPLKIQALIDTGASRSQIDLATLIDLGILMAGEVEVFTASTGEWSERRGEYVVNLGFAGDKLGSLAEDLAVIGTDGLAGLKVKMLLGRDVLDRCLLVYDGPNRRFALAYDPPA